MGIEDREYMRQQGNIDLVSAFATRVYSWMTLGLGITATIAYLVFTSGLYISLISYTWIFALAGMGVTIAMSSMIEKMSFNALTACFFAYAAAQGLIFGSILPLFAHAYGGDIIWTAFASAAGLYGVAVLYGMFTRSDLTSLGQLLNIGLMGLVAVTLITFVMSFFTNVAFMDLVIAYFGLIIFVGLSAYDANTIREYSHQAQSSTMMGYKLSIMMALKMYINIIMIFWYLLRILASRRD